MTSMSRERLKSPREARAKSITVLEEGESPYRELESSLRGVSRSRRSAKLQSGGIKCGRRKSNGESLSITHSNTRNYKDS